MTEQPLATIKQRNYIGVLFGTRGINADSERMAFIKRVTGVETGPGLTVLTRAQAGNVITALKFVPLPALAPNDDPFEPDWQD